MNVKVSFQPSACHTFTPVAFKRLLDTWHLLGTADLAMGLQVQIRPLGSLCSGGRGDQIIAQMSFASEKAQEAPRVRRGYGPCL